MLGGAGERKTLERDFPPFVAALVVVRGPCGADSSRTSVPGTSISIVQQ